MFVVLVNYVQPLAVIDGLLAEHVEFLDRHFAAGTFLASGRRVPRTGGMILARAESREVLSAVLAQDPFAREGAAEYEILEVALGKAAPGLEALLAPGPGRG
jgi:uncharacterized protein YciI